MKAFRIGLFALTSLALLGTAWARPVLVAPIRLSLPSGTDGFLTFSEVGIDGDTLMVTATHVVNGELRYPIHIFERASNAEWNYTGVLVHGRGSLFLEGNLAVFDLIDPPGNVLVFERGAQGWTQTATIDAGYLGQDYPISVDNGTIFMRRYNPSIGPACARTDWVLRKVSGQWRDVATLGAPRCEDGLHRTADINDGRVLIVHQAPDLATPQPPADVLTDTGAPSWTRVATLTAPQPQYWPPTGTIASNWAATGPNQLYRNTGGNNWVFHGQLKEPEVELSGSSTAGVLRGNTLFIRALEADYELPELYRRYSDDPEIPTEWWTLRVYRPRANGYFDYYARLSVDFSLRRASVSNDGRRAAAISFEDNVEYIGFDASTRLYVFEIPDSVSFAGTQQDTFENGNFSRWTPTAGSFAVATNGATRVLRQSNLTGDAGAYLTALDWQDQSIEADLRPVEFAGNDRWFGLVARRVDASNYYYVTLRASGRVSLRRLLDGTVTELAYKNVLPFVPGRNYRVRLESVGDQLAVSIDGIPRVHVKDTSFTHGHPGIAGYRTRFEVDNVIVSPATRLLVRLETPERQWWADAPADASGEWTHAYDPGTNNFIMRQSVTSGDARWFSKTVIGNQVVSARMRPMSYGTTTGTQVPWVGIAAHVVDAQNYYYLTLRRSNQVSLRRVINGQIQVIATVPQPVTTGAWHDLRLEMIGTNIRAFVNGELKIQTTDPTMSGGGGHALLMYKTAADTFSHVAYQP